ncbi:MAG: hypothetical protein K0S23_3308 [Fluviicola sp.]|jgi:hypothetical protein|uniref:hypothetical protein n=1 Tax=Fluviicola sp. TaxID=1917219 RepID=UPI00262904B6|nr:hypothetical protein [Fluviicola sp.]MDF3029001.1 hypothetical protein [Fluviicola sp.]
MRLVKLTVAALCVGMTFVACEKDKLSARSKKPVSATETEKADDPISKLFRSYVAQNTVSAQFNALNGGELINPGGNVRVSIDGSALTRPDGTLETGQVTISMFVADELSDNALGGMPTQSAFGSQQDFGGGIVTAGSMRIEMFNAQGEALQALDGGVVVNVATSQFNPEMTLWIGEASVNQPRDNVWVSVPDPVTPGANGQSYNFNWSRNANYNIDMRNLCPGLQLTDHKVTISGSAAFNRTNTQIYVVLEPCTQQGQKIIFSLDMYNATPRWWFANPNAKLPIGYQVTYVAITSYNNQLFYGNATTIVTPNMTTNIPVMMPTTMAALMAYLNSL